MLNFGVGRRQQQAEARQSPKRVQTLISGVVVAVAGRGWVKSQKRAVVLAFRAGRMAVATREDPSKPELIH